jgi:predicted ABC-type ATPase
MRVFAGPNGSGKSTIIKSVREYSFGEKKLDFGIYINADDIASDLRKGKFSFAQYKILATEIEFKEIAFDSGLINENYPKEVFNQDFNIEGQRLVLVEKGADERLAQVIAHYLRKKLLQEKKKFSFETVFSHSSKLDIIREANKAGYKVYLYFVSTRTPELNKQRVKFRVLKNGHDVPEDKIESRYYRSLDQLYDAAQLAYQAYVFDNSGDYPVMFAHFKQIDGEKQWDEFNPKIVPYWFQKYYTEKVNK